MQNKMMCDQDERTITVTLTLSEFHTIWNALWVCKDKALTDYEALGPGVSDVLAEAMGWSDYQNLSSACRQFGYHFDYWMTPPCSPAEPRKD